jgi:hypothetical protein
MLYDIEKKLFESEKDKTVLRKEKDEIARDVRDLE